MRASGEELPAAAFAWRPVRCLADRVGRAISLEVLTTQSEFEMTNRGQLPGDKLLATYRHGRYSAAQPVRLTHRTAND
jgi:hypothetical protein